MPSFDDFRDSIQKQPAQNLDRSRKCQQGQHEGADPGQPGQDGVDPADSGLPQLIDQPNRPKSQADDQRQCAKHADQQNTAQFRVTELAQGAGN